MIINYFHFSFKSAFQLLGLQSVLQSLTEILNLWSTKVLLSFWQISAQLRWARSFWTLRLKPCWVRPKPFSAWDPLAAAEMLHRTERMLEKNGSVVMHGSDQCSVLLNYSLDFSSWTLHTNSHSWAQPWQSPAGWAALRALCQAVQEASEPTQIRRANKARPQYTRTTLIWRPKCKNNYLL